ncbi:Uu.00g086130.m01.CDS01 [Anthostomella pinea]|uniref:Uu.00g086130.m01.CDS01 n=1 Tax=Anthostomella pinea TaxID=933095 RepID=A0AAI8YJW5_9PEZI|nr:Uu.00g086130.m01.CDS01 [Anthostomella pinea]
MSFRSFLLGGLNILTLFSQSATAHPHGHNAPVFVRSVRARDTSQVFPNVGNSTFTVESAEVKLADGAPWLPRIAKLSDGTVLAVSTRFENGTADHVLQLSRSTNGGQSFSHLTNIAEGPDDIDNGFLLELPASAASSNSTSSKRASLPIVLVSYRDHEKNADGSYNTFRIKVARSENGGQTWNDPVVAVEKPANGSKVGIWEAFMRFTKDGKTIQMTYSGELAQDNQETFRVTSPDFGASWTAPVNLRLHSTDQSMRDGMQSIAEVSEEDGTEKLIMELEVKVGSVVHMEYVISEDDGETWGHRGTIYKPAGADHSAGAGQIARIGDTMLALVFLTDEDYEEVQWPDKGETKALFSDGILRNGALRWAEKPLTVFGKGSIWPGVVQWSANSIMALASHDKAAYGRIVKVSA